MNDKSSGGRSAQNRTAPGGGGEQKKGTANRVRQVAAIIGIILLVAMYVVTLIAACMGSDSTGRLFRLCLGMTIAVPIFLWIFIWCVGKLTGGHSMASMDILNSNPEERRKMEEALQRDADQSPDGEQDGAKN